MSCVIFMDNMFMILNYGPLIFSFKIIDFYPGGRVEVKENGKVDLMCSFHDRGWLIILPLTLLDISRWPREKPGQVVSYYVQRTI